MRTDNHGSDALHPDGDGRDLMIQEVGGTFFCVCTSEVFPFLGSAFVECHECGRNYKCVDDSDSWMEVWASE